MSVETKEGSSLKRPFSLLPGRAVEVETDDLKLGTNAFDARVRRALREKKLAEQAELESRYPRVLSAPVESRVDESIFGD